MSDALFDIEVDAIDGERVRLEKYRGKVLLVVNTASRCGLTPQYRGLETLHEDLEGEGLVILGFPCNQFAGQEPEDEEAIGAFCDLEYGVRFPMHRKIEVNGSGTHPLFALLKEAAPGILGSRSVKWNFTKFLVGRDGEVLERFAPKEKPEALVGAIREALAKDA
jgi:glutathione peroxidase